MRNLFVISVSFLLISIPVCATGAIVDADLIEVLQSNGTSRVMLYFSSGNSPVLQEIREKSFPNRLSKVRHLTSRLQSLSSTVQSPVQEYLKGEGVQLHSFWASNQIIIESADLSLVRSLSIFPQVSRIRKVPEVIVFGYKFKNSSIPWGIRKVKGDRVWERYGVFGNGVVVANIDTGVRATHEALRDNWRQDHGWFDPSLNTTVPTDDSGHGTHVMGTMVGSGGIGMAPGATWIACRGCATDQCDAAALNACGQWVLSPTNPDGTDPQAALIPDIVSNSWGVPGGHDDWYNPIIEAWTEAGILHAFAIGNSGPLCRSGSSPGDQRMAFSVGSLDEHDKLSRFSSKGPVNFFEDEYLKPDVSAPGSDVYSAWSTSDSAYKALSGTSMATPAVGGLMALMISSRRGQSPYRPLDMEEAVRIIENSTDRNGLSVPFPNSKCSNEDKWPNYEFGYGRINALKSVSRALKNATELLK